MDAGAGAAEPPARAPHLLQNAPVMLAPQVEQKAMISYHLRTNVRQLVPQRNVNRMPRLQHSNDVPDLC
jgi:hypothetical protein